MIEVKLGNRLHKAYCTKDSELHKLSDAQYTQVCNVLAVELCESIEMFNKRTFAEACRTVAK